MAGIEVRVPDLGSFKDVAVIDLLVKPGDSVDVDTPLVTLETDKATMDVPSPSAGVVEVLHLARGAKVNAGDLLATLRATAAGAGPRAGAGARAAVAAPSVAPGAARLPAATAAPAAAPVAAAAVRGGADVTQPGAVAAVGSSIPGGRSDLAPINEPGFSKAHAGPSVRRFARELGVDLAAVRGSGLKGRITQDDVKAHVKRVLSGGAAAGVAHGGGASLPAVPVVDFAAFGGVEVKPLGRVQRISAARLHAAWVNLPHVTQFDQADITDLEDARGKLKQTAAQKGIKLTPLAFIVRACVRSLAAFPLFGASLDAGGQTLVYKKYCHIGFAADTPNGLLVPVIRDADRKDIYDIARSLAELSEKARTGKLTAAEMQGGCFTISSLGGIGGTAFTPIINAPEVAILGVSRSSLQPVWRDSTFVPRLMLPLSLSYDHRVIDGAAAARFTTHLCERLADVRGLLEAVP
jgi:pyruvate dehydrogenase E2 component (dihydrolipoamide acetyltransferase)